MGTTKSLLDELLVVSKLLYISDLRNYIKKEGFLKALDSLPQGCYSEKEWHDAFVYLTGKPKCEGTEAEIRALLKQEI